MVLSTALAAYHTIALSRHQCGKPDGRRNRKDSVRDFSGPTIAGEGMESGDFESRL